MVCNPHYPHNIHLRRYLHEQHHQPFQTMLHPCNAHTCNKYTHNYQIPHPTHTQQRKFGKPLVFLTLSTYTQQNPKNDSYNAMPKLTQIDEIKG